MYQLNKDCVLYIKYTHTVIMLMYVGVLYKYYAELQYILSDVSWTWVL